MKRPKGLRKCSAIQNPHQNGVLPRSTTLDPVLTSLFSSSLGPVKIIPKKSLLNSKALATTSGAVDPLPEYYDSEGGKISSVDIRDTTKGAVTEADNGTIHSSNQETVYPPSRKRKRNQDNENLEGRYMYRLGQEEAKENAERLKKKLKQQVEQIDLTSIQDEASISDGAMTRNSKITSPSQAPQHEALTPSAGELELDKASRTVFLANVSSTAIKSKSERKKLIEHLESFASEKGVMYKIESLRFRSTAFASSELPKKAAFVKKELMDSTTKSTNAYAVYTTQAAAREAVKQLNGSVILDRHLRVDGIAHPAKIDHRRCVFVGNLSFVDDESEINSTRDDDKNRRQRKGREPGDAEEGLWRQFDKAGKVESVRVIRDKTTRVGKGFAYVQFQNENGVEKALSFNGKKFPPMLPRILRVTRAKKVTRNASQESKSHRDSTSSRLLGDYKPKLSSKVQSLSGRVNHLFGRAGASQFHQSGRRQTESEERLSGISRTPQSVVFEGYRASSKQSQGSLKSGGSRKKHGKPSTRSSKRGAKFKASGGKKRKS